MKMSTATQLLLFALFALSGCRSVRVNCFTCIEACTPFVVSACEPYPDTRIGDPIACSCNPYQRVDTPPPVIGPVTSKGGR